VVGPRLPRSSWAVAVRALPPFITVLIRRPELLGTFGLIWTALCGALFLHELREYRSYPSEPVRMTADSALALAKAGEERWVALTDIRWDCEAVIANTDERFLELTSAAGRPFVGEKSADTPCESLPSPPQGVIGRATGGHLRWLHQVGGARLGSETDEVAKLCSYCGPGNARIGLMILSVPGILGLVPYPTLYLLRRLAYGS